MRDPTTLTLRLNLKAKMNSWHLKTSASPTKKEFNNGLREIRTIFLQSGENQLATLMIHTSE